VEINMAIESVCRETIDCLEGEELYLELTKCDKTDRFNLSLYTYAEDNTEVEIENWSLWNITREEAVSRFNHRLNKERVVA
jgi:hypothetical protein